MHINIGNIIKQRRVLLNITQETLSDLSGVGLRTIVKIENNNANPSLDVIKRIADVLGMEVTLQIKTLNNK